MGKYKDEIEFSVVMPCLNEAATLGKCLEKARSFFNSAGISAELVVADNGSTDASWVIATKLADKVISVPSKGYGHALRGGIEASHGRYVIMGDADDSYDFSALGEFVKKLRAGYDLVMGNRFGGGIRPGAMPWLHRYVGNPVLSAIGRILFPCKVGDFHCGLRGFSRRAYDRMTLQSGGMEFASEMVLRAVQLGLPVTEIPVILYPDGRNRKPHLNSWRDGWAHLILMLSHFFLGLQQKKHLFFLAFLCIPFMSYAQEKLKLTLREAVELAADSSLNAFVAQNAYMASYWEYRMFKAERLPALSLSTIPLQYNQNFVKRYDSQQNVDVYKPQKSLYSSVGLSVKQNIDWTGGVFTMESSLDHLYHFGVDRFKQNSSVPLRIGYSQNLLGFNPYKWSKKIEPIKYEKAKKQFLCDVEAISGEATNFFFLHALNQVMYEMSVQHALRCDTLYRLGQEKYKIGSLTQADLLVLHLNVLNARNGQEDARMELDKSAFMLASFLRLKPDTQFLLVLPSPQNMFLVSPEEALALARTNHPTLYEQLLKLWSAEQNLDYVRKNSRLSASVSASVGFNQVGNTLAAAYRGLLRQDMVMVSVTVPLLDWGMSRGKVNMARSNLNMAKLSYRQAEEAFEQSVLLAVKDFNGRFQRIKTADEACKVAELAYSVQYQRFFIGKSDVDQLAMALNRQNEAQRNYINALHAYWTDYYKIRKFTLYDFEHKTPISFSLDKFLFPRKR